MRNSSGMVLSLAATMLLAYPSKSIAQSIEETLDFIFTGEDSPTRTNGRTYKFVRQGTADGNIDRVIKHRNLPGCIVGVEEEIRWPKSPVAGLGKFRHSHYRIDLTKANRWSVGDIFPTRDDSGRFAFANYPLEFNGVRGVSCSAFEYTNDEKFDVSSLKAKTDCRDSAVHNVFVARIVGREQVERTKAALTHLFTMCRKRAF